MLQQLHDKLSSYQDPSFLAKNISVIYFQHFTSIPITTKVSVTSVTVHLATFIFASLLNAVVHKSMYLNRMREQTENENPVFRHVLRCSNFIIFHFNGRLTWIRHLENCLKSLIVTVETFIVSLVLMQRNSKDQRGPVSPSKQ